MLNLINSGNSILRLVSKFTNFHKKEISESNNKLLRKMIVGTNDGLNLLVTQEEVKRTLNSRFSSRSTQNVIIKRFKNKLRSLNYNL